MEKLIPNNSEGKSESVSSYTKRTPEEEKAVLEQLLNEADFRQKLRDVDQEDFDVKLAEARSWAAINDTAQEEDFQAILDEAYSHPEVKK